ncbi:serine/threonine-protein kinase [Hyphomonas beringensis]|nr:serine/threonine-protein kinase [Hyphomonas beringensis]
MPLCPNCKTEITTEDRFCPECGTETKPPAADFSDAGLMTLGGLETIDDATTLSRTRHQQQALETGEVFADRYIIEEVIGRGGMGLVYKAKDMVSDQTVALKLIRSDRLGGEMAVKRLISEGVTARNVRHPNVVAVYDVGDAHGQPYVSMEYLQGQSLRGWHRKKIQAREDIPLRHAARIVAEILDGLSAAHAAGVIHRDLKPENIILMDEPTDGTAPLKILDFGIAQATTGTLDSGTGTGIGTPRYMAPEQITHASSVGPEADLYSLSVLFYELLVDVLPQGHWQPPSGGRSDVPIGIDKLIERGLSNRPASRPQSAQEYRKELVEAVNLGYVPRKKTPDTPEDVTDDKRGLIKLISLATIGVVGLVVMIAGIASFMEPGSTPPPPPPCDGLTGSAYQECINPQEPVSMYQSLNGQWNDGIGSIYSMRVSKDGSFSGTGTSADGYRLQMSGRMNGVNGSYTVTAPAIGVSMNGRLQWDRGCHISFQTFDAYNNVVAQGQMHVNHQPGGPCPS